MAYVICMAAQPDIFHALADPTRRAVFERLARGEATVSQLTANFKVSQPAISQHLATLKRARLVSERRVGRHAYYGLRPEGLKPLVEWIDRYQGFWRDHLERMKTVLEEMP